MSRGQIAEVGSTRWSANGYHYTKVKDRGWVLTHRLTAEKMLGREILPTERISFKPGFTRKDYNNEEAIQISTIREKSIATRRAWLEAKIEEYQAELDSLGEA